MLCLITKLALQCRVLVWGIAGCCSRLCGSLLFDYGCCFYSIGF